MVVTKESIGNVNYEDKSRTHFQMKDVPDQHLFSTDETDLFTSKAKQELEGGMGKNHERIGSFHKNAVISDILSAAAVAATRRLTSNKIDLAECADAVRVLEIVEEQRAFVQDRILAEQKNATVDSELIVQFLSDGKQATNTDKAKSGSLDDRITAARTQANQQCLDTVKTIQKHSDGPNRE